MECYLLNYNINVNGWLFRNGFYQSSHRFDEMVLKTLVQSRGIFQAVVEAQAMPISIWNYLFKAFVDIVNSDRSVVLMLVVVYVNEGMTHYSF